VIGDGGEAVGLGVGRHLAAIWLAEQDRGAAGPPAGLDVALAVADHERPDAHQAEVGWRQLEEARTWSSKTGGFGGGWPSSSALSASSSGASGRRRSTARMTGPRALSPVTAQRRRVPHSGMERAS
jgi:hypothetical protein